MESARSTDPLGGPHGRGMGLTFVITSSGMGGAEQQVAQLARTMQRRGWDVGIISMLPLESPISDLADTGIRVTTLGMSRGVPDPRAIARLRAILAKWRPDVTHGHMVHANLLVRLSRPLLRTRVLVSTIHNQDEGSQWRYWAYRLTDRLGDTTTAVSQLAADEAVRRHAVPAGRLLVVPNGVDTRILEPDAAVRTATRKSLGVTDSFLWLAVGRLAEAKGYPGLIEAFQVVRAQRPDAILRIAGVGPLHGALQDAIAEHDVTDAVQLLGLRTDVRELMQAADGFVLSSLWEGLPMVLLEAAASALPIVATDVGGSREVVNDGSTGHLVPPMDPPALADAMLRVMSMPEDGRRAMGSAGRLHVARTFELEAVADRWEAIYRACLRRRPG